MKKKGKRLKCVCVCVTFILRLFHEMQGKLILKRTKHKYDILLLIRVSITPLINICPLLEFNIAPFWRSVERWRAESLWKGIWVGWSGVGTAKNMHSRKKKKTN